MRNQCQNCMPNACSCAQPIEHVDVFSPVPINATRNHSILTAFAVPFQPQSMPVIAQDLVWRYQTGNNFLPGYALNPDAAKMEERIRNMAPFQTPPSSPSFRSVPMSFEQPEKCGGAYDSDQKGVVPFPTPISESRNTMTYMGIQEVLRQQPPRHTQNMISKLLTEIPKPINFVPSNMVLERGMAPAPNVGPIMYPNGQYQGNRNSSTNKNQIANLVDSLNCALFLRNIPSETPLSSFFDCIDTGAVYALHIMPPNGIHSTCAAKLTFMTPEGAARFLDKIRSGMFFGGYRLEGRYNNREGYLHNMMTLSRVIFVEGPEPMMTVDYWFRYFRQVSVFQWDRVNEHATARVGMKRLEFRFARINGQAQTCLQQIKQQEEFVGLVEAWYGPDPCDPLVTRGIVEGISGSGIGLGIQL